MATVPYSIPQIYRGQKEWFISFRFTHSTGVRERYRLRLGLNRIKDLVKREQEATILRADIEKALKKGKIPIPHYKGNNVPFTEDEAKLTILPAEQPILLPTDPIMQNVQQQLAILIQQNQMLQAQIAGQILYKSADASQLLVNPSPASKIKLLDRLRPISISEGKGKSEETKRSYRLYMNRLKWYLEHIERPDMTLEKFIDDRAQDFKEYMIEELELKNATVNCTIVPIKKFFELLFAKKEIPVNPFYNVSYLPKHRGSTFIAFDREERKEISALASSKYPELYLFMNFIYSCFLRPKEICTLTPADIDLNTEFVRLRVENAKVSHTSHRQILPGLKALIKEYNILSMPRNRPIFDSIGGTGNDPRAKRRKIGELYKSVIKKSTGIMKEMYGLKHTGNIDYLKNLDNVNEANLLWLKHQNDHSTLETTQIYIRDLGIYKMKWDKIPFGKL